MTPTLPCPWCGGTWPAQLRMTLWRTSTGFWVGSIMCDTCAALGPSVREAEKEDARDVAALAWDGRVTTETPAARVVAQSEDKP